jgi:hypothetical protein
MLAVPSMTRRFAAIFTAYIVLLLRKYENGGSLPLATARASAVFRYPLCGGHPRNAPVLLRQLIFYKWKHYNRTVYASRLWRYGVTAGSGLASLIPAPASTRIFAVAGTLRVPLSQPQKRHIPP